ncbi:MAG: T9SS type A sorting domain-containing protein [Candidatus Delongbacteria bacterium]|nr:T9SS type A sorting domain-containing protein [Candidatus Delongbacteria bacterium]
MADIGTDSLYIVGASATDGYSDKDLNGGFWRTIYVDTLTYQISNYNELGKEMPMFSTTQYTPQLVIIGQDSKVVFSHFGYITETDIRVEIRKALDGFGNLQQIKKTGNIFMDGAKSIIDLSEYFIAVDGDHISYDLLSISDDTIVNGNLIGSQLTLNKGSNTGIANIKVRAMTSYSETVIDSFDVMIYPSEANILDFETGSLYEQWFHEGDADWIIDDGIVFEGINSARSGYIETPGVEGEVTYSLIRTTFESTVDDTLAFAYKISSQYDSDGFEILIDGMWVDFPDSKWSGEVDWSFAEYFVEAGKHTVEWDYFKYEYGYAGKDAAWIDIVKIPGVITSIEEIIVPSSTKLVGNYPNPFNGSTTITYQLSDIRNVKLAVYNIKGEFVQNLVNGVVNAGMYSATFNALNINSGVYFYKLEAGEVFQTGKMIYLK